MARGDSRSLALFAKRAMDPSLSLPPQITAHVRTLIAERRLIAGKRMPSTRELATLWKTHVPAVHRGLAPLVREGWLERRQGSGTFVRERPCALKTIGLYYYGGTLAHPEARFLRALHHCLLERIGASGRRWMMLNDPRPQSESAEPWDILVEACRNHEVDAVVVPTLDPAHVEWICRLPVPIALATSARLNNRVEADNRQFGRLAVEALVRQGCRSVGLISAWPSSLRAPKSIHGSALDLHKSFMAATAARKVRTKPEWIVTKPEISTAIQSSERWGYDAFGAIWRQTERPEGLVVVSDIESIGVTTAIVEQGIRVPQELKLAYQKSTEVDILCPLPVTYVVSSADDMARGLIEVIERQFHGEPGVVVKTGFWAQHSQNTMVSVASHSDGLMAGGVAAG
jgi:DNA-binding LacI/PurR family transcriptional regulator